MSAPAEPEPGPGHLDPRRLELGKGECGVERGSSGPLDPRAPRLDGRVTVPRERWWRLAGQVLEDGGPGYLQFAITNLCNADCGFCGFARSVMDPARRRSVTLAEGLDVVDAAGRNGIGYLLFVGGEPLVHRDLRRFVRYAAQRGIRPMLCTNGALWTERLLGELTSDGLASVIMSVDAATVSAHEGNRGLPGVCERIRMANAFLRRAGIPTTASVTMSRLIGDYGALPGFLRGLGFETCTFSYPLTELGSGYLGFSPGGLVRFTTEELLEAFEAVRSLKREGGIGVMNPDASLAEMQRHLRGEPERFACLGGYKYFYVDWHLNVFRCHYWEHPLCTVPEWTPARRVRDDCTRCMIDCYRDPSVLQHAAVNMGDAWQSLRRGEVRRAAGKLFDRRNLESVAAVVEDWKWITRL